VGDPSRMYGGAAEEEERPAGCAVSGAAGASGRGVGLSDPAPGRAGAAGPGGDPGAGPGGEVADQADQPCARGGEVGGWADWAVFGGSVCEASGERAAGGGR